jgi:hypothetical protein
MPTRTRRPHPADLASAASEARAKAEASHFEVYFRKSAAEAFHEKAATFEDAENYARALDAEHGRYGRRAGIYAVLPSGQAVFLPREVRAWAPPA